MVRSRPKLRSRTGLSSPRGHGSRVTFVTVRPAPAPVPGDPNYECALTRGIIRARAAVEKAHAAAEASGVEADAEIVEGDAADEIVRFAQARKPDLLVLGSRNRPSRTLLGSVSRAVVRAAELPVLVAKHRAPDRLTTHAA